MGLPAILCLHGSGVNSKVFKFQLAALQRTLSKTFDFVFLDGPFERSAGDGVLPFFDGCEPFFRWKSKSDDNVFSYEEIETEVQALIQKTLKTRDDWVGILGFSQGGRVAAGLLAEQEKESQDDDDMYGDEPGFKFGVFFCTPSPPMTKLVYEEGETVKLRTPSIIIAGKKDKWYESSKKMQKEYFSRGKLIEYDIDHRIPTGPQDITAIAKEMLRLYNQTTGEEGVLS